MEYPAIGLLDFGVRHHTLNSLMRVDDLITYASDADALNYSRLWLGEHHINLKAHTWSDPTILLPVLAGVTDRIRVGVAGVLIGIHQPYHVATQYKMLANIFPRRIDLGIANSGVMPAVAEVATGIKGIQPAKVFKENMEKLFFVLRDEAALLEIGTVVPPYKGHLPELWSLTTSMEGALARALEHRTHLSRSIFHTAADKEWHTDRMLAFKEEYFSRHGVYPKVNLVFSGVCHKTEAKAQNALSMVKEGFEYNLIGTPSFFQEKLLEYQERYAVDELIFMNVALEPKDRRIGIELLADAMHLGAAPQKPAPQEPALQTLVS